MSTSPGRAANGLSPAGRFFLSLHIRLYQMTGGKIGGRLGPQRILLLTTTGRKSGLPRTQPLAYFEHDSAYVVVASNWGREQPPAWYLNLLALPQVNVQLGGAHFGATATVASDDLRARLWPDITRRYRQYARYQASTSRQIPLVLLRPGTPLA